MAIVKELGHKVRRLIIQNFGFAIGYKLKTAVFAFMGFMAALIASIAMSLSSAVVTLI